MTITSDQVPAQTPEYFGRGVRLVRTSFPGTHIYLVHDVLGHLIGQFQVRDDLPSAELEHLLWEWLDNVDPLPVPLRLA